jgi:hypothetical protein
VALVFVVCREGLYGLGAELAAGGGYGDVAEALWAGFGGRWFHNRRVKFLQEVLGWEHEKEVDDGGDEYEVDDGGEEVAVADLAPVNVADEIAEVGLADDGPKKGINNFFGKRRDNPRKCSSNDDGDSEINDVATQNEIAESFEHEVSLLKVDRVWNRLMTGRSGGASISQRISEDGEAVDRMNRVPRNSRRGLLLRGCDPAGVGVEEKEENHAEGHEVHVDAEDNAGVIEAPAALHAADGIGGAGQGEQDRKDEEEGGAIVGEVGEEESDGETEENEETAA